MIRDIIGPNVFTALISCVYVYTGIEFRFISLYVILMVIDFILGIGKSLRLDIPITSKRIYSGVFGKCSTILVMLAAGISSKILIDSMGVALYIGSSESVLKWFLGLLVASETYSIMNNFLIIKAGEGLPEFELVAIISKKIREIAKIIAGKYL